MFLTVKTVEFRDETVPFTEVQINTDNILYFQKIDNRIAIEYIEIKAKKAASNTHITSLPEGGCIIYLKNGTNSSSGMYIFDKYEDITKKLSSIII